MPLPRRLAQLNRTFTNRILGPLAAYLPWFGVVHHRGRSSGSAYTTPVNVFGDGDRFVIALTYGADTDWLHNITVAGGCWLGIAVAWSASPTRNGWSPTSGWRQCRHRSGPCCASCG